jgi:hypothetical protein
MVKKKITQAFWVSSQRSNAAGAARFKTVPFPPKHLAKELIKEKARRQEERSGKREPKPRTTYSSFFVLPSLVS